MSSLWPWLAVAGAGALHGLNPCSGWALAAACAGRDSHAALRALVPLALGHAASVAIVAAAVALGLLAMDALPLLAVAGAAALALLLWRRRHRGTGLALWSFTVTTLQGSGLMLVPAFIPLCLSASPAREITASGSLALALAAVSVHLAAMLAVTAGVAWLAVAAASRMRARHRPARHEASASRDHRPAEQPHRPARAG